MKHRGAYWMWLLFLLVVLGLGVWLSIASWTGALPDPVPGLQHMLSSSARALTLA